VNPNLIRSGQVIYLPPRLRHIARKTAATGISGSGPTSGATHSQANVGTRSAQATAGAQHTQGNGTSHMASGHGSASGHNPAADMIVNNFAFAYQLDKIPAMEVKGVGFTASIRPRGTVFLQSSSKVPLLAYSNRGAEMQARQQTTTALGQLIST